MVFDVAKRFDVDIDMHIDETEESGLPDAGDVGGCYYPGGLPGRVTAGHCCALTSYDDHYARQLIEKVALAGIRIITNPLTNLYLQGRGPKTPIWRGITRVKELLEAGVNVACGLDDIRNLFLPYGRMNMLEVALFTSLAAQMTTPEQIQQAFSMSSYNAAKILGWINTELTWGIRRTLLFYRQRISLMPSGSRRRPGGLFVEVRLLRRTR